MHMIYTYIIYIYNKCYVLHKLKKQNYILVGKQFLNFFNDFKYKHLRNQWRIRQARGRKGTGAGEEEEVEEGDEKYPWEQQCDELTHSEKLHNRENYTCWQLKIWLLLCNDCIGYQLI